MRVLTLSLTPSAVALALAGARSAHAQGAADPGSEESIVVQGKFIDSGSKSAMKLDVPVRDTPFSVSSYSDSFMKAIETTNVADMYKYMTGVARTGGSGNDLNMRGFSMTAEDRNAILVNGLPGLAGRFGSPPTAAVDHVELVKGPASVLYGAAQPGGFVNIVSKKPQATQAGTIDLIGQTYAGTGSNFGKRNGGSAALDVTGPVDAERKFRYRLVGEIVDRNSFRHGGYEHSNYLAPSITWVPVPSTSLTLIAEHRKSDTAYDLGLAAPFTNGNTAAPNNSVALVAARQTRYQQPNDFRNEASNALTVLGSHDFTDDITWNFSGRTVRHHDDAKGFDQTAFIISGTAFDGTPCTAAQACVRMRARGQHNERRWDFYDTNLNLKFDTAGVGHKVLLGLNGGREKAVFERLQFFNGAAIQNLNNPSDNLPPLSSFPIGTLNNPNTISYSTGLYVSDVMTLSERWKATLGARYARDRQHITPGKYAGTIQDPSFHKALPMAGLLFQPTQEITLYGSYATSYVPAAPSSVDENNRNSFKPEESKQAEAGLKYDAADGRVTATAAVYSIKKANGITVYPCPATAIATGDCSRQIGKVKSDGLELELNLRPTDAWQLTAGYAYTDAKVVASAADLPAPLVGARLVNVPKNSFHIWSRYDFSGAAKGLGVGAGLAYLGERSGLLATNANQNTMQMPGYTTVDAAVYYTLSRYDFALKINNVFDRNYIESSGFEAGALQVTPGAPRNLQVSMRVHF